MAARSPIQNVLRTALLCLTVVFAATVIVRSAPAPKTCRVVLRGELKRYTVLASVADTEALQHRGLMGRTVLPLNEGMLFVFPKADRYSFWMKDTPLPLTIIFIDDHLRVAAIFDMEPLNEIKRYAPPYPCRYALEINLNLVSRIGLKKGCQVDIRKAP